MKFGGLLKSYGEIGTSQRIRMEAAILKKEKEKGIWAVTVHPPVKANFCT